MRIRLAIIAVFLTACGDNVPQPDASSPRADTVAETPPPRAKTPCPVKLTSSRMVHNLEEDVYTTVTNTSDSDITAIGFGAEHTDKFGDTWTTYKTSLTSEETIKRGKSRSLHWEVLMEQATGYKGKPGSSGLFVDKVAFADGRSLGIDDIDGCTFTF